MAVKIDTELEIIRSGRYGEDVRIAIHDALEKLNQNGGKSSGSVTYTILLADVVSPSLVVSGGQYEEVSDT